MPSPRPLRDLALTAFLRNYRRARKNAVQPPSVLRAVWAEACRRGVLYDEDIASDFLPLWAGGTEADLGFCDRAGDRTLCAIAASCPALRVLRLEGSHALGEEGLKALCSLPSLETLSFRNCTLPDKALLAVASAPGLKALVLQGCVGFADSTLRKALQKCLALETLDLTNCRVVTSSVVRDVAHLGSLVSLSLSWCSDYSDAVSKLAKRCKKLEHLGVAHSRTTDSALAKVLSSCPALTSLDVSFCPVLQSDKAIKALANVQRLAIGGPAHTTPVTDQVLLRVAQAAPKLESLDVQQARITADGLRAALDAARALRSLAVICCHGVPPAASDKFMSALRDSHPQLRVSFVPVTHPIS